MGRAKILRQTAAGGADPEVLERPLAGKIAWRRQGLAEPDYVLKLERPCLEEISAAVAILRQNPLPIAYLSAADFELECCRRVMRRARSILEEGVGFVVIDRLPLADLTAEEAKAVYWLLGQMVARPVAQNWAEGALLYDVLDQGRPLGYGVRPDVTNRQQNFHTDNSYNLCPPRHVALLCLSQGVRGGESGVVSFQSAHNVMRRRHPELLRRLYQPYLFDRQKEHGGGEEKILSHPLFAWDGLEIRARLSRGRVLAGYDLAGLELDAQGLAALDAFEAILEDPELNYEYKVEPGQIQLVHNLWCVHRRTGFQDGPEQKRHMVRLWLRDEGRRFYSG